MLKLSQNVTFESFIRDSFKYGTYHRELRLTDSEVENVKKIFPNASMKAIAETESLDKKWYEVNLKNPHM